MAQRRQFTAEFKTKVVLELISEKKSLAEASREYKIKDTVLSRWKREFVERAGEIFEQPMTFQDTPHGVRRGGVAKEFQLTNLVLALDDHKRKQ